MCSPRCVEVLPANDSLQSATKLGCIVGNVGVIFFNKAEEYVGQQETLSVVKYDAV